MKDNTEIRNIKAVLNEGATLEIKSATNYSVLQQDNYHSLINNLSKDKVKEALHEQLDFPTYDVLNFDYKENKSALPPCGEEKIKRLTKRNLIREGPKNN